MDTATHETHDKWFWWAVGQVVDGLDSGAHFDAEISLSEFVDGHKGAGFQLSPMNSNYYYIPDEEFDDFRNHVLRRYKGRLEASLRKEQEEREAKAKEAHERLLSEIKTLVESKKVDFNSYDTYWPIRRVAWDLKLFEVFKFLEKSNGAWSVKTHEQWNELMKEAMQ